jgi:ELWxxDGT repeat protein
MTTPIAIFAADGGLWVTDGTAAGTTELQIAGAGAFFNPGGFTAFGNEVLFSATDEQGETSLWVTDGTSAGTREIPVSGADPRNGPQPANFTVFGDKVLFSGTNSLGLAGLWITGGTSAGTTELQVAGASPGDGLQPSEFTVLGKRRKSPGTPAFFSCADSPPWTLCVMCCRHPPFPR